MSASRDDLDRALSVAYDEIDKLRAQLAERDALLLDMHEIYSEMAKNHRPEQALASSVARDLRIRIRGLSASAEPTNKEVV